MMMMGGNNTVSDSDDSSSSKAEWAKGLSKVEQMFVLKEFQKDQGFDSDDDECNPSNIPPSDLPGYKAKARKMSKALSKYTK